MPSPTVPAAALGLPADQKSSRRALLKVGTAATAALIAVPVAILPGEADAAMWKDSRIASLWAQWQALNRRIGAQRKLRLFAIESVRQTPKTAASGRHEQVEAALRQTTSRDAAGA